MQVALGSTNNDKVNILREALSDFEKEVEIIKVAVQPNISEQPLSEEETIKGAINRAKSALIAKPEVDFAVGLEGGLTKIENKGYFLVCVAAICNRNNNIHLGISSKLQLPEEVSDQIDKGGFFGTVIRDYAQKPQNSKNLAVLLKILISRKQPFIEAIRNAYLVYKSQS